MSDLKLVPPAFAIIYDLSDPDTFERARRDRRLWGVLYTDIHTLDNDHIVLTFRPAPDPRWRAWEAVRREWILGSSISPRSA